MKRSAGWNPPDGATWTTRFTFVAVALLIVQLAASEWFRFPLMRHLSLAPGDVGRGEVWALLTHPFAATLGWESVLGWLAFWFLGHMTEDRIGRTQYLLLLGWCVVAASAGHLGTQSVDAIRRLSEPALGGWGTINIACLFALVAVEPSARMELGFVRPPMWLVAAFWVLMDVGIAAREMGGGTPQLWGHVASGIAAFALVWFGALDRPAKWVASVVARRRQAEAAKKREQEGHGPYHAGNVARAADAAKAERERVDALLEKIGAEGIASLTEAERTFLNEASKRYR